MDIIYRAAWRHRDRPDRGDQSIVCDTGHRATLRLALAVLLIGSVVGFLDLAANRTQAAKDGEAVVIVQTGEGD